MRIFYLFRLKINNKLFFRMPHLHFPHVTLNIRSIYCSALYKLPPRFRFSLKFLCSNFEFFVVVLLQDYNIFLIKEKTDINVRPYYMFLKNLFGRQFFLLSVMTPLCSYLPSFELLMKRHQIFLYYLLPKASRSFLSY